MLLRTKIKKQSLVSNAFFRLLFSYENGVNRVQSAVHKDKIFNYGYVGKFERTFLEKDFAFNYAATDTFQYNGQVQNAYVYQDRTELPVKFTPADLNPDAALFTSYLVSQFPTGYIQDGSNFNRPVPMSLNYIAGNGGFRNGDNTAPGYRLRVKCLYDNFGVYPSTYRNTINNQFRASASFNADIKNHAASLLVWN